MVIMCLVVLVPFITSVYPVEIFGFSRSVFIMPPIDLQLTNVSSTESYKLQSERYTERLR